MDNQILVCIVRYAPVEPPFEHGKRLGLWQGLERQVAVKGESGLRADPPSDYRRGLQCDMEIDPVDILQSIGAV